MQVTVTFRHMESSNAIRDYAKEKTERVTKYLAEPIEVHWVLSVQKFRHIAGVTINGSGAAIKGEEETEDMYAAIDMVMAKMEKQMRRHKEKLKGHKPASGALSKRLQTGKRDSQELMSNIVRIDRSSIKPMTVDEAMVQIHTGNDNFIVFADTKSKNINVLYKLKDGNYGLIETAGR